MALGVQQQADHPFFVGRRIEVVDLWVVRHDQVFRDQVPARLAVPEQADLAALVVEVGHEAPGAIHSLRFVAEL